MAVLSSSFWDDLLEFIEERRVIPIVGSELLRVSTGPDDPGVFLHTELARRLALKLDLPAEGLSLERPLYDVVSRHMARANSHPVDVYPRLRSVMKDVKFPIPEALRRLARISHFNLYVTTTFDTLLEDAINQERFGGGNGTASLAYAPNDVHDLPCELDRLEQPTVFHIMGRVCASPDYVLTDEDLLEFMAALQSEKSRPALLFDELRNRHLLLIGCSFPDWLARFFIRLAKGGRLSGQRNSSEVLADHVTSRDPNLVVFLESFSRRTMIFPDGGAAEFVAELSRRYHDRHPATPGGTPTQPAPPTEMKAGSIFISYAREDTRAAVRIYDALTSAGLEVWLDQRQLTPTDQYGAKIRRRIRDCSIFLPIVSASTENRTEGYFRMEWNMAAERALYFDDDSTFIVPVKIDDIREDSARVPAHFAKAQWVHLPDAQPGAEFVESMRRAVRAFHKGQKQGLPL